MTRCLLGAAFVPFNATDLVQQADDAAGQAFGIRDAVAGQAFAKVEGFSDIQYTFSCAAHQVNGGHFGEGAEKILAEPLDERLGRVEKPELPGGHARNSTWTAVNFQP